MIWFQNNLYSARVYWSCSSWGCFMEDAYPVWKLNIINSVSVNWR